MTTSVRIPYYLMAVEIEKLYQKEFPPGDKAVLEHCEYIAEVIKSMGWTEEEYLERWMREQDTYYDNLQ